MPLEVYFTLISLGLFILAAVYTGALAIYSPSRLFYYLVSFSLACLGFSIAQALHVNKSGDQGYTILVQLTYSLILLFNPLVLHGLKGILKKMPLLLKILFCINATLVLTIVVSSIVNPALVSFVYRDGRWEIGIVQHVRGAAGMLNWTIGLLILFLGRKRSIRQGHDSYLYVGYLLLAIGSLLDAVLMANQIGSGRMTPGFYPGMLSGLLVFQVAVTLSLTHSYREREVESESSIHAIEESKKELMRMAYFDDMTGRPNRKSFLLHLNHHIIDAQSTGKNKAIFLLDLDNFRDVNDTFGYSFGDLVIRDVGEKIEDRFGIHDRLYRLYGNQFAIIWDEIRDRGHALDLARIILEDLTSLVEIDDSNLYMGVSLGAALLPEDGDDVNEVFRRCESALAEAKKDKNTFFFYSSELENRTRRKMSIVNSLREALKKDLFDVVFQPIVRSDGSLAEMEALIRSSHPGLKEISPEVYISVAESSGLIIPITWWLIEKVAREALIFARRVSDVRININMSPKVLKSRDLMDRLLKLNERHPINGSLIGFEITEGAIIENVDQVLKNLRSLRERGFQIALDDFGTGYSSLSYIKNLPLDKIKIDQRFISGISRDNRDEALINSIISIAENLKMELVAEGVEMPNQLVYLKDRGVHYYQGYLFSKPVQLKAIIENYSLS